MKAVLTIFCMTLFLGTNGFAHPLPENIFPVKKIVDCMDASTARYVSIARGVGSNPMRGTHGSFSDQLDGYSMICSKNIGIDIGKNFQFDCLVLSRKADNSLDASELTIFGVRNGTTVEVTQSLRNGSPETTTLNCSTLDFNSI